MPVDETAGVRAKLARDRSQRRATRAAPWWQRERERLLLAGAAPGTPRYVYHLPTVRERARALADVGAVDRRFYAIKANSASARSCARSTPRVSVSSACRRRELEHVFALLPAARSDRACCSRRVSRRAANTQRRSARGVMGHRRQRRIRCSSWPELFRGRADRAARSIRAMARAITRRCAPAVARPSSACRSSACRHSWPRPASSKRASPCCMRMSAAASMDVAALAAGVCAAGRPRRRHRHRRGDRHRRWHCRFRTTPDGEPFDLAAWRDGLAEIKAACPQYRAVDRTGPLPRRRRRRVAADA